MKSRIFAASRLAALTFVIPIAPSIFAQNWTLDSSFSPAFEADAVRTVQDAKFVQTDGKLIISPSGSSFVLNGAPAPQHPFRLNADGTLDSSYQVATKFTTLAAYPDGRTLVTELLESNTNKILLRRLLSDGSVDSSFAATTITAAPIRAVLLNDGRVLIAGGISSIDGGSIAGLAIIKAGGGRDPSFVSPLSSAPSLGFLGIAVSPDGLSLYVAAYNLNLGPGRTMLARLSIDGTVDTAFGVPNGLLTSAVSSLMPQPDGRLLLVHNATQLMRLTATGAADATFIPSPVGTVVGYGSVPFEGKILYLTTVSGSPAQRQVRRLNLDGTDDAAFPAVSTPDTASYRVDLPLVGADGNLYFGAITADRYAAHATVTRVAANGAIDAAYNPRFSNVAAITAYARQADGKHLVAGSFAFVNGAVSAPTSDLVRLNANGTTDTSFTAPANFLTNVVGLFPLASGKVIAVGVYPSGSGNVPIVRLNADGSLDGTFQPIPAAAYSTQFFHYNISVDSAGYVYVLTTDGNIVIKRYTPDGVEDPTFQSAALTGAVLALCATTDGTLLVARRASSGQDFLTRLTHTGTLVGNIGYSNTNTKIFGLAALPNGDAAVFGLHSVTYLLQVTRIKPTGSYDYIYTVFTDYATTLGGIHDDKRVDLAGSLFDLLLDASANPSLSANLAVIDSSSTFTIDARADGSAFFALDRGLGLSLSKMVRTSLQSPSVSHPVPYVVPSNTPPVSPIHVAVNSAYNMTAGFFGGITPSYQWLKDGVPIAGKTQTVLSFLSAQASDAGSYSLQATNAYGTTISDPIVLIIDGVPPVSFTTQPISQTVTAGATATFTAVASSGSSISYVWRRNGVPINGATGSSLVLPNVAETDSGAVFDVVATSNGTSATSSGATLTVTPAFARTFFGSVAGGGSFALYVRTTGEATMLISLPGGRGSFLVKFTVATDGSFNTSFSVGSALVNGRSSHDPSANSVGAATLTLSGSISGSSVTASTSAGDALSGTQQAPTGPTAGLAGLYQAPLLLSSNSTLNFIVGSDGSIMMLPLNYLGGQAVNGAISSTGAFSLNLAGGLTLNGSINANGGVAGEVVQGSQVTGTFGGLSALIPHTDRLINISTRGRVDDGDKVLIAGFVVTGSMPKDLLVRVSGPTLSSFGLGAVMDNPVLTILRGSTVVATNDDWGTSTDSALLSSTAMRVGAFGQNPGGKDAAVLVSLAPGIYSAQITRAPGSSAGLALVEVYDAGINPGAESQKLVNISTRGEVRTGEGIMIGGFVITGNVPKKVLIRAVGPTLAGFGVSGVLADPVLTLLQGQTVVASNDNWGETPATKADAIAAANQVGAFALGDGSKESVLLVTLAPGLYSAQVSGAGNSTGVALLEVYEVP